MPYTYKKEGDKYVVYKKDTGKKVGSTKGTKEALRKYLAALHLNAEGKTMTRKQKINELAKLVKEQQSLLKEAPQKLFVITFSSDGMSRGSTVCYVYATSNQEAKEKAAKKLNNKDIANYGGYEPTEISQSEYAKQLKSAKDAYDKVAKIIK